MRVFAAGNDPSTFVNISLQNGQPKSVSLKQLSQMDEAVHTELYITLIQQILRDMPVVTPSSALKNISRLVLHAAEWSVSEVNVRAR
jgi:hypothetical protein